MWRQGYAECQGCIRSLWAWLSVASLCKFVFHCPHNIGLKATERLLWSVSQWKKNIYLHCTGLHMYITYLYMKSYASTSMEALVFWAFLFGYQATHIFVPENQLHVLWEKLEHTESLWKFEFSRPCFCAVVERKKEEMKPELNQAKLLFNKCIGCTRAIRKQWLFLFGWHGADCLQPRLFRFAPTVFCPKSVFKNSESYYATSSAATQVACVGSKEQIHHLRIDLRMTKPCS